MVSGQLGQFAIGRAEGIIVGRHEDAPLQAKHGVGYALARCAAEEPASGRGGGKIRGPQQSRLARDEIQNLLAIPDVVSARKHFDPRGEQLLGEPRRDAEAGSGVLAVGDHQIGLFVADDVLQALDHDSTAGRAHDVPDE